MECGGTTEPGPLWHETGTYGKTANSSSSWYSMVNGTTSDTGITSQALSFFRVIKSFFECQKECVTKQSMTCLSRNVCGLAMPPNSEVILSVKMCAIANGMGTDGLRRLCMCTAAAGARQLAAICPRIVLS